MPTITITYDDSSYYGSSLQQIKHVETSVPLSSPDLYVLFKAALFVQDMLTFSAAEMDLAERRDTEEKEAS